MLHPENRQGGKESLYPLIFACVVVLLLAECGMRHNNPYRDVSADSFSGLRTSQFVVDSHKIRKHIEYLCRSDRDTIFSDYRTRKYYRGGGTFLWIERLGVDSRADTLLAVLRTVGDMGFTIRSFDVEAIESDLERMRTLEFDENENSINHVMARLEFRLTKAYLRYVIGQRFGFTNPLYMFNRLDELDVDSSGKSRGYRRLFDVPIQRPDSVFIHHAMRQVRRDSIGLFLRSVQPESPLYYRLQHELKAESTQAGRMRILCNMERCRWREKHPSDTTGKYIVVNIPAYHLYAYGGEELLDMRVGCGATKTKTPLLTSAIEWMEINPVWNIPMSIISKEVASHAGDLHYFERNRYYIVDKNTGDTVEPENVTASMLRSGNYRVAQEGGEGNSLGRIVFRFPNNFSVFLHDTSSRGVFRRDNRGVSHGCVRVQNPFGLAVFLLDNPDEWLLDKLRISMDIEPETDKGRKYIADEGSNTKLVRSLAVKPHVPLFITYYTIYPDMDGRLNTFPDVYGYDRVMEQHIKPFMK